MFLQVYAVYRLRNTSCVVQIRSPLVPKAKIQCRQFWQFHNLLQAYGCYFSAAVQINGLKIL